MGQITLTPDQRFFELRFPYDEALVAAVRQLPQRKWDGADKVWRVPASSVTIEAVLKFARERNFEHAAVLQFAGQVGVLEGQRIEASKADKLNGRELTIPGLGGTLYPFQEAGVRYVLDVISHGHGCLVADAMGLGKTVEAIAVVLSQQAFPCVVVCPATLKYNWEREIHRWAPGKTTMIVNGRTPLAAYPADFIIINYDVLQVEANPDSQTPYDKFVPAGHTKALMDIPRKSVILDESHLTKAYKSIRSRASRMLMRRVPVRLALTGTPVMNRPDELVTQLGAIGQLEALGGFDFFMKHYVGWQSGRYGGVSKTGHHLKELNDRMRAQCYIRREKDEVLPELPPKQRSVVPFEIANRKAYDRASGDLIGYLRGERRDDEADKADGQAGELVRIERLKQLAAEGKLKGVIEWVKDFLEGGEKLVVFAHHQKVQQDIWAAFPGAARLFADDDMKVRQENIDRFQDDPKCQLIVCSLQAGGVGITLTAASNVALIELGWNPAAMDQAEDRLNRIGQRNAVTCHYLIARDTIEEDILALLEEKRKVVEAVSDGRVKENASVFGALLRRLVEKQQALEGM